MSDELVSGEIKADKTLDCRGLSCPMPVLRTKKAIEGIEVGKILEVIGTDPGSKTDIPAWAKRAGHEYLGMKDEGSTFRFYVRRSK